MLLIITTVNMISWKNQRKDELDIPRIRLFSILLIFLASHDLPPFLQRQEINTGLSPHQRLMIDRDWNSCCLSKYQTELNVLNFA